MSRQSSRAFLVSWRTVRVSMLLRLLNQCTALLFDALLGRATLRRQSAVAGVCLDGGVSAGGPMRSCVSARCS